MANRLNNLEIRFKKRLSIFREEPNFRSDKEIGLPLLLIQQQISGSITAAKEKCGHRSNHKDNLNGTITFSELEVDHD